MKHREMIISSRARIKASQERISENRENKDSSSQPQVGKILRFPVQAAQRERVEKLACQISRESLPAEYMLFFDMVLRFLDRITQGTG